MTAEAKSAQSNGQINLIRADRSRANKSGQLHVLRTDALVLGSPEFSNELIYVLNDHLRRQKEDGRSERLPLWQEWSAGAIE